MRTNARSATILPSFVGLRFEIHNGKVYNPVEITEDMVGHKLGEFSPYEGTLPNPWWYLLFSAKSIADVVKQDEKGCAT